VRRNLTDAGFEITRVPGFGRKRHMTRGVLAQ
jgi:tRNA U34 5-methylaminomethyl-2-thiouridine-forming methyltransferase MnmC